MGVRALRAQQQPSGYPSSAPDVNELSKALKQDDHGGPDAKKKPQKSAFDFESRAKKQDEATKATESLADLRAQQKAKYQAFEADPNAKKQEAYQRPASVADGGKNEQGWGDWFGGMFGGGGSSSGNGRGGGGGNNRPQDRGGGGPRIKTVADLPKPVQ